MYTWHRSRGILAHRIWEWQWNLRLGIIHFNPNFTRNLWSPFPGDFTTSLRRSAIFWHPQTCTVKALRTPGFVRSQFGSGAIWTLGSHLSGPRGTGLLVPKTPSHPTRERRSKTHIYAFSNKAFTDLVGFGVFVSFSVQSFLRPFIGVKYLHL